LDQGLSRNVVRKKKYQKLKFKSHLIFFIIYHIHARVFCRFQCLRQSRMRIGWTNELANKSNLKNPTHLDTQSVQSYPIVRKKNPIKIPKIQLLWIFDIERGLNIQLFWIFGVRFGWVFIHPYNQKSRKKFFLILSWAANFNAAFCSVDKVFSDV
jgi:hypothetical protein